MTTPDEKAAAFDPAAIPPPPVETVADLTTSAHTGLTITVLGITGELTSVYSSDVGGPSEITVQEADRPFPTRFTAALTEQCEIVGDATTVTDVIAMDDYYALARELDRVSTSIRSNDAANKQLKERKQELSEKMLAIMARLGQSTLAFDDRRAYIHRELYPEFETRDDGTKYTYADLVPVFRSLGRAEQITPETVNYRTVQGVLREIRNGVIPMFDELAAMVKIGEKAEVRTGVGRKSTR
jgi:hypothetical protein